MKKIAAFVLIGLVFGIALTVNANAYTFYGERYIMNVMTVSGREEVIIFYTCIFSAEETDNLPATMQKLASEITFQVFPAETLEIRQSLAFYLLTICCLKTNGEVGGYIEYSLSKEMMDAIISKKLKTDSI